MFGDTHGMAMGLLTFDWGQITYSGSPLPVPWWAAAKVGITVIFFYWFLVPILYVSLSRPSSFPCSNSLPIVRQHLVHRLLALGLLPFLRQQRQV